MKKLLTLLTLALVVFSACETKTTVSKERTGYAIGDYEVSFDVPEGLMVSSIAWEDPSMELFIAEMDLSEYMGEALFKAHQIRLYEDQSIEDRKALYENDPEYAPLSIEIDGRPFERVIFYSEYADYTGVTYMMEYGDDVFEFSPATDYGKETPNSDEDLLMIDLIESFEVL